jgi:hypothetical protein
MWLFMITLFSRWRVSDYPDFGAIVSGGKTVVERDKSKQFNSRGNVQHCSSAYRSCENDCRIVMVLGV